MAEAHLWGMLCDREALAAEAKSAFEQRGYYIKFMRMPTFGPAREAGARFFCGRWDNC